MNCMRSDSIKVLKKIAMRRFGLLDDVPGEGLDGGVCQLWFNRRRG